MSQSGTDQSGVTAGSFIVLYGPSTESAGVRLYGLVTATQDFRIDFEISSDGGATWTVGKSINSALGNDATYTRNAEINQYLPNLIRVRAKNTSASSANFRYDIRRFNVADQ